MIGRLDPVRVLAFEGGGILGIAYLRPVEMLEDAGVLGRVHTVAGGSVGAIVAASLAISPHSAPLERLLLDSDLKRILGSGTNLWSVIRHGGSHTLDRARSWLSGHLSSIGADPSVPLSEIPNRYGRELRVSVTDETNETELVLGRESEMPLIEAVVASMAVPVHFLPLELPGGRHLSDGGLAANLPLTGIDCDPLELLAFRLASRDEINGSNRVKGKGIIARARRLVRIARASANRGHIPRRYWDAGRIVTIDCGDLAFDDWGVARRVRDRALLLQAGEDAFRSWINPDGDK